MEFLHAANNVNFLLNSVTRVFIYFTRWKYGQTPKAVCPGN